MAESKPEKLFAILNGEKRYGARVDNALRRIASHTTGDYLVKWFNSLNDESPTFRKLVIEHAKITSSESHVAQIADRGLSDSGQGRRGVRIRFKSDEAAYYQFHVFPPSSPSPEAFSQSSRKRSGCSQLILFVPQPDFGLSAFVELCQANPHVLSVEEIAESEFWSAPSDSV